MHISWQKSFNIIRKDLLKQDVVKVIFLRAASLLAAVTLHISIGVFSPSSAPLVCKNVVHMHV